MELRPRHFVAAGMLLCTALALALAWSMVAPAPAGARGRVVTVGVYENAPKVHTGAEGAPSGLFIDLLRDIAR